MSDEVGWRKPHHRIYQETLDRLRVDPGECTFIGDTRSADYIGPRSMGMRALLIDPHHHQAIPAEDRIASVLDVRGKL